MEGRRLSYEFRCIVKNEPPDTYNLRNSEFKFYSLRSRKVPKVEPLDDEVIPLKRQKIEEPCLSVAELPLSTANDDVKIIDEVPKRKVLYCIDIDELDNIGDDFTHDTDEFCRNLLEEFINDAINAEKDINIKLEKDCSLNAKNDGKVVKLDSQNVQDSSPLRANFHIGLKFSVDSSSEDDVKIDQTVPVTPELVDIILEEYDICYTNGNIKNEKNIEKSDTLPKSCESSAEESQILAANSSAPLHDSEFEALTQMIENEGSVDVAILNTCQRNFSDLLYNRSRSHSNVIGIDYFEAQERTEEKQNHEHNNVKSAFRNISEVLSSAAAALLHLCPPQRDVLEDCVWNDNEEDYCNTDVCSKDNFYSKSSLSEGCTIRPEVTLAEIAHLNKIKFLPKVTNGLTLKGNSRVKDMVSNNSENRSSPECIKPDSEKNNNENSCQNNLFSKESNCEGKNSLETLSFEHVECPNVSTTELSPVSDPKRMLHFHRGSFLSKENIFSFDDVAVSEKSANSLPGFSSFLSGNSFKDQIQHSSEKVCVEETFQEGKNSFEKIGSNLVDNDDDKNDFCPESPLSKRSPLNDSTEMLEINQEFVSKRNCFLPNNITPSKSEFQRCPGSQSSNIFEEISDESFVTPIQDTSKNEAKVEELSFNAENSISKEGPLNTKLYSLNESKDQNHEHKLENTFLSINDVNPDISNYHSCSGSEKSLSFFSPRIDNTSPNILLENSESAKNASIYSKNSSEKMEADFQVTKKEQTFLGCSNKLLGHINENGLQCTHCPAISESHVCSESDKSNIFLSSKNDDENQIHINEDQLDVKEAIFEMQNNCEKLSPVSKLVAESIVQEKNLLNDLEHVNCKSDLVNFLGDEGAPDVNEINVFSVTTTSNSYTLPQDKVYQAHNSYEKFASFQARTDYEKSLTCDKFDNDRLPSFGTAFFNATKCLYLSDEHVWESLNYCNEFGPEEESVYEPQSDHPASSDEPFFLNIGDVNPPVSPIPPEIEESFYWSPNVRTLDMTPFLPHFDFQKINESKDSELEFLIQISKCDAIDEVISAEYKERQKQGLAPKDPEWLLNKIRCDRLLAKGRRCRRSSTRNSSSKSNNRSGLVPKRRRNSFCSKDVSQKKNKQANKRVKLPCNKNSSFNSFSDNVIEETIEKRVSCSSRKKLVLASNIVETSEPDQGTNNEEINNNGDNQPLINNNGDNQVMVTSQSLQKLDGNLCGENLSKESNLSDSKIPINHLGSSSLEVNEACINSKQSVDHFPLMKKNEYAQLLKKCWIDKNIEYWTIFLQSILSKPAAYSIINSEDRFECFLQMFKYFYSYPSNLAKKLYKTWLVWNNYFSLNTLIQLPVAVLKNYKLMKHFLKRTNPWETEKFLDYIKDNVEELVSILEETPSPEELTSGFFERIYNFPEKSYQLSLPTMVTEGRRMVVTEMLHSMLSVREVLHTIECFTEEDSPEVQVKMEYEKEMEFQGNEMNKNKTLDVIEVSSLDEENVNEYNKNIPVYLQNLKYSSDGANSPPLELVDLMAGSEEALVTQKLTDLTKNSNNKSELLKKLENLRQEGQWLDLHSLLRHSLQENNMNYFAAVSILHYFYLFPISFQILHSYPAIVATMSEIAQSGNDELRRAAERQLLRMKKALGLESADLPFVAHSIIISRIKDCICPKP